MMQIPRALLERFTEALCYAASLDKVEIRALLAASLTHLGARKRLGYSALFAAAVALHIVVYYKRLMSVCHHGVDGTLGMLVRCPLKLIESMVHLWTGRRLLDGLAAPLRLEDPKRVFPIKQVPHVCFDLI